MYYFNIFTGLSLSLMNPVILVASVGVKYNRPALTLDPKPEIGSMKDFNWEVKGAGGQTLPYHGYAWVTVQVRLFADQTVFYPCLLFR